jgi:sec-independent protein translocase protein TatC
MGTQDTFISHLIELRTRLMRALGAVLAAFVVVGFIWPGSQQLYTIFATPILAALPAGGQMIATDVVGVFLVPIKVAALVGFVIALPYVLYEMWAFVAPGLYAHEKSLVLPLVVASFVLFVIGMAFAYFLVFPLVFNFLASIAPEGVAWMTDIEKYFSFALTSFIAFGVTFEVPVVVIVLVRAGLVSIEKLKEIRPYVIVGAFVVGAIFTPPDVVSQVLLAMPLWLLYEIGILVGCVRRTGERRTGRGSQADGGGAEIARPSGPACRSRAPGISGADRRRRNSR